MLVSPQKIPIILFPQADTTQYIPYMYLSKEIILEVLGNGLLHDGLLFSRVKTKAKPKKEQSLVLVE